MTLPINAKRDQFVIACQYIEALQREPKPYRISAGGVAAEHEAFMSGILSDGTRLADRRSLVTALHDYVAKPGLDMVTVHGRMTLARKLTGLRVVEGGRS